MLTSYNGWTASPSPADFGGISPLIVAGRSFAPGLRNGDVHIVFTHYFTDYHETVEELGLGSPAADEWGYNFRQNRNANNLSCHASATAGDANATLHPNGKKGTMSGVSKAFPGVSKAQATRNLAKGKYRGLIRWGGDYTGTVDEMHHEIIGTPGQIAELARELQGLPLQGTANLPAPNLDPQPWLMVRAVRSVPMAFQQWYNKTNFQPPLLPIISPLANNFGPKSLAALKKFQKFCGLVPDGIDGPLTKRALYNWGWR